MTDIHLDFESFSAVDLKVVGLDNYARHPTTAVWCMGYARGDEDVRIVPKGQFYTVPHVMRHVQSGGTVVAHNAAFELAVWNHIMVPRYGWPALKPEQCRCTMVQAYSMALPGSLENAAAAVGIVEQKDLAGHRLMLQMMKPRETQADGTIIWWDEPDKLAKLYEYCRQDVRVERELDKRLMRLSADEQALWVLDQTINNRGVYVDREAVTAAIAVVQAEQDRLNKEMRSVTGNFVGFCTEVQRLKEWVSTQGIPVEGLAKADVTELLIRDDLPKHVRRALELRQQGGKSSTAKLAKMLPAISDNTGRLTGILQFHGAGTGRWAGRAVQLHNLPRPPKGLGHKELERAVAAMKSGCGVEAIDTLYGPPTAVVSYALRQMFTAAPGHVLYAADFANIEGRALAWLADEKWKLEAYRAYDTETGPDLYLVAAAAIHQKPIEDCEPERQTGKVSELSLGYQGGIGAFRQMEKTLGLNLGISDARVDEAKIGWRRKHSRIVRYWSRPWDEPNAPMGLEDAALAAVKNKGEAFSVGPDAQRRVTFKVSGSFLWCLLPSGRVLCYPYPQVRLIDTPWGQMKEAVTYFTVISQDDKTKTKIIEDPANRPKWSRVSTYGGKLAENITQAICRDLLAFAMRNAEAAGYPVVLHVHDEVVAERPAGTGSLEEYEALCSQTPAWAAGLPVVASGWVGERYRK